MAICGDDWDGPYHSDQCPVASGMRDIALLKIGIGPADIMNGDLTALDIAKITALVGSGDIVIANGLSASLEPATAVTAQTYVACGPETYNVTYDRTVNISDPNTTDVNIQFWNSIDSTKGVKLGGMLLRECNADRVTYIDAPIYISGNRISPQATETQRFEKVGTWREQDDPRVFPDVDEIWDLAVTS
jgi:hypothetical protein